MDFVEDITDFIFVEDKPERADLILIPGGDQGALAVTAARLYREGYAPYVLPSGRYSKPVGQCQIPGYEGKTEWDFLHDILCGMASRRRLSWRKRKQPIPMKMRFIPGRWQMKWDFL